MIQLEAQNEHLRKQLEVTQEKYTSMVDNRAVLFFEKEVSGGTFLSYPIFPPSPFLFFFCFFLFFCVFFFHPFLLLFFFTTLAPQT